MAKEKVIKYTSPYTFKDAKDGATNRNMTIDEMVFHLENRFDDPRAEVSLKDAMLEYHEMLLSENNFQDSIAQKYAYNGYTVLDTNIRRPAFNTFAMKHVPHIYGGGAVETDKGFFFKPIIQEGRLASGNNNKVNLVSAESETLEAPILPITLGLAVGIIDQMKADTIGFDIIGAQHEAVKMSYAVELDKFAFVGHRGVDGTSVDQTGMARGLLNLASGDAIISDIETKAAYAGISNKVLEDMSTTELVSILAKEFLEDADLKAYDPNFLANKWLIYPNLMSALSKPAHISNAGTVYYSHLAYLKQVFADWAGAYGGSAIQIESLPYLNPVDDMKGFDPLLNEDGTNNAGRTVLYRQDPYVLRTRLALDLTPGALVYDPANGVIRRNYIAFIGTPLLFYPGYVRYIDNGTSTGK